MWRCMSDQHCHVSKILTTLVSGIELVDRKKFPDTNLGQKKYRYQSRRSRKVWVLILYLTLNLKSFHIIIILVCFFYHQPTLKFLNLQNIPLNKKIQKTSITFITQPVVTAFCHHSPSSVGFQSFSKVHGITILIPFLDFPFLFLNHLLNSLIYKVLLTHHIFFSKPSF